MKRGGPLKRSEKAIAVGGLPAPTKAQEQLFKKLLDQVGCAACLFFCRHEDGSRVEDSQGVIHHLLSGTKRISHWHVLPLCKMHHDEGRPGIPSRHSIMGDYGKAEFERTYTTEMELVVMCEEWINQPYVTGLATDDQSHQPNPASNDRSNPDPHAEHQPDHPHGQEKPLRIRQVQAIGWPVHIRVTHYLYRRPDMDNLNAKGGIDGLVKAGILKDDSPTHVKSVQHDFVKVKRQEEERTRIELVEANS